MIKERYRREKGEGNTKRKQERAGCVRRGGGGQLDELGIWLVLCHALVSKSTPSNGKIRLVDPPALPPLWDQAETQPFPSLATKGHQSEIQPHESTDLRLNHCDCDMKPSQPTRVKAYSECRQQKVLLHNLPLPPNTISSVAMQLRVNRALVAAVRVSTA